MLTPKISVIVPVHDGARYYDSALESIGLQRWRDLEIIVVDDGSTDALTDAIRNRSVPVRYLRQPHRGPAAARNLGLREASGKMIAFLDIDDRWTPGHLDRLHEALLRDADTGIAQGLMQQFVVLPDGRCWMSGPYRMPYLGTCLFKRDVLERCGYFDEGMQVGEDYDLMFRCWENDTPKRCVEEVSLLYRRHAGNMTRGKNLSASLRVVQRRMRRIRSGAVDPLGPRRYPLDGYIGDIGRFSDDRVALAGEWNL